MCREGTIVTHSAVFKAASTRHEEGPFSHQDHLGHLLSLHHNLGLFFSGSRLKRKNLANKNHGEEPDGPTDLPPTDESPAGNCPREQRPGVMEGKMEQHRREDGKENTVPLT